MREYLFLLHYAKGLQMYGFGVLDLLSILISGACVYTIRQIICHFLSLYAQRYNTNLQVHKFTENGFYACFYVLLTTLELVLLGGNRWFWHWVESVEGMNHYEYHYHVKILYIIQMGFYLQAFILLFSETSRSRNDFKMMIFHHTATSVLLLSSFYLSRAANYGCLVLFLHDISDIPLFASKALNYYGRNDLAVKGFSVFVVMFVVCRLILFPFLIATLILGAPLLNVRLGGYTHVYGSKIMIDF
ncbi:hypothetical protein RCL1_002693 [Eukaryota sp. TZLM3-RCL]